MDGEHGACGERREVHTGFLGSKLREGDHFKDVSIDGRIILKCVLTISVRGCRFI
jgi:hypothetical protein